MSTEIEVLRKFLAERENSDPLETARVFGIDISLLQHHLSLSQKERIRRLQEWMRFQSSIQWSKSKN